MEISGKTAIVTGAASVLGRAFSLVSAREGALLVIADLDEHAGSETLRQVRELGAEGLFATSDAGKPEDAQALVDQTMAHFGHLDVACNNAGVGSRANPKPGDLGRQYRQRLSRRRHVSAAGPL